MSASSSASAFFSRLFNRRLFRPFALILIIAALGMASEPSQAQSASCSAQLRAEMAQIAAVTRGPVGAAVLVAEGGNIIALRGEQRFPMQSTYKLLIGMAALHQVDLGKLSLNQRIHITPAELPLPPDYSPLREKYPKGADLTVLQVLDAMMSVSDNTASDCLLKQIGGPQQVTVYLRGLGIQNIVVATFEKTMAQNEQAQYRNWATPDAMAHLLRLLQQGIGLSLSSRHLLLTMMIRSQTGPDRIKGLLPTGTVVAHKTGSSGSVNGLTRATNDVGIVTLPDGRHLVVIVFVSDTRADAATQAAVIARIARAAWDYRAGLEGKK